MVNGAVFLKIPTEPNAESERLDLSPRTSAGSAACAATGRTIAEAAALVTADAAPHAIEDEVDHLVKYLAEMAHLVTQHVRVCIETM